MLLTRGKYVEELGRLPMPQVHDKTRHARMALMHWIDAAPKVHVWKDYASQFSVLST